MRRGDIWLINLDPTVGAEIKKTRPAIVVSDDAIGILPLLCPKRGSFNNWGNSPR